jgi:SHS2 domain-containing protein
MYTEKLVLHGFDIVVGRGRLTAQCAGQRLKQGGPSITREIKAATYHNLEITYKEGIYSARIIFDI